MDTFELLPVLAAGDLSQTSAPELVAAIYRSRASGTLSLEGEGKEEIRLFFRSGDACGAARPAGFRSLTQVLLGQRMISEAQAERAGSLSSTSGKRLGEVLLDLGILTQEQLYAALAMQHRENLRLLLLRNVGHYEWRGWEPPPPWAAEVTIDPTRGILEALALPQHAGRRQTVLRWLGDAAVRASFDFAELAGRSDLLVADRRAAELFAQPTSARAFLQEGGLQQARAEALLVALLLVGGVEPLPSSEALPLDASSFEAPQLEPELADEPLPHELSRELPPDEEELPGEGDGVDVISEEIGEPPRTPALSESLFQDLHDRRSQLAEEMAAEAEVVSEQPHSRPALHGAAAELFGEPGFVGELDPEAPELVGEGDPDALAMAAEAAAGPEQIVHDGGLEPLAREAAAEAPGGALDESDGPGASFAPPDRPLVQATPVGGGGAPHAQAEDAFASLQGGSQSEPLYDFGAGESGSEPALELDTPQARSTRELEPPRSDDDARALRKKLLQQGLRNMGVLSPPQAQPVTQAEEAGQELRAELSAGPLTEEERAFLDEVRARARVVQRQDAYARLGVSQTATQDHIRAAYLGLVKRFHPDRAQSPALMPALPDLEALFSALRDAYECLGAPEARAAYDASARLPPQSGQRITSKTDDAQLSLRKGEVFLKKRDFENALRELRRAVDLDASPEALTALSWALANDRAQGPAGRDEALKLVERALRLDRSTSRTHYVAGVLKRTTEPEQALQHFRSAVELDPRNGDAALELRLLERRQQQKKPGSSLSRLFKRDGK